MCDNLINSNVEDCGSYSNPSKYCSGGQCYCSSSTTAEKCCNDPSFVICGDTVSSSTKKTCTESWTSGCVVQCNVIENCGGGTCENNACVYCVANGASGCSVDGDCCNPNDYCSEAGTCTASETCQDLGYSSSCNPFVLSSCKLGSGSSTTVCCYDECGGSGTCSYDETFTAKG